MGHPHWPLFDLRVATPRLELRYPDDSLVATLVTLAAAGIHDPDTMPFGVPWTDAPPGELERSSSQFFWRTRAQTSPESWSLPMAVLVDGEPVGVQSLDATSFAATRVVETGSWLGRAHQGRGIGKEMRSAILHLAFAGLAAEVAQSGAWHDNAASLAVSRALGYEPNGERRDLRRGVADRMVLLRLPRATWERTRRDDITIVGLERGLCLLGLDPPPS